ncbi:hypothetical protein ACP45E_19690, partial [Vibrio genomosp. F10 str. 9ZD137]
EPLCRSHSLSEHEPIRWGVNMVTEQTLQQAYLWVCHQRRHHPPNADIWHFRFNAQQELRSLQQQLHSGLYRLSPMQRITKTDGSEVVVWSSRDAIVLML